MEKKKMTLKEAKDFIENNVQIDIRYCSDEEVNKTKEAFEIAMAAIDKRIPKKPNTETINRGIDVSGEYDIDSNYICPDCGAIVGNFETEEHYCNSCDNCGQTLDWSDT